jgi:ribonuclease R
LAAKKKPAPFPTRDALIAFIRERGVEVTTREIVRAFGLKGAQRTELKRALRELREAGVLAGGRKRMGAPGALPPVTVVEIAGVDPDGEILARPIDWRHEAEPPRIVMAPDRRAPIAAMGVGERMLARLTPTAEGEYEAKVIRRITTAPERVLGVYEFGRQGGRLVPTDRRYRHELAVARADTRGAEPGELVLAEVLPGRRVGLRQARVVDRLGDTDDPRAVSLIAIHSHDIPVEFPGDALAQAEAAAPTGLRGRTDLRALPLVTIDGADARDFDDAVWAAPDDDPKNKGGWQITVAIADVAHYVRPDDPLDRAAFRRGNSVYFPDRVVPMLPEALSNGLCSLKPNEDRGCLACHMRISRDGKLLGHRFERGLMRSAARLTYEQVQAAFDGKPDDTTGPILKAVLAPLRGAYESLEAARAKRQTLEIDLPERRIVLSPEGKVERIAPRPRYVSHKLIEEFMIAANVAAAETLIRRNAPCMFRVHEPPDPVKLENLREFVGSLGYALSGGTAIKPMHLNRLLKDVADTPHERMIHELVLRSQAQARYQPANLGHYGLALSHYAHFTSPIRRYSDLLVHRALIGALKLGKDGIAGITTAQFEAAGEHISTTERRASAAERDAADRYVAAFLADKTGATFAGVVTGVTRFGLFVALDDTGADGLVPISSLGREYFRHDEARHRLVGSETGAVYTLGERVEVILREANPVSGGLVFNLLDGGAGRGGGKAAKRPAKGRRPPAKPAPRGRRRTRR